ncbi:MAG: hypothetical protein V1874_01300 [Spirochaetota bacterium]
MNLIKILISVLIIIIFQINAAAFEIYNFTDNKERNYSGFILGVDETSLSVLTLEGKVNKIDKESIKVLYIYNIVLNPIEKIDLNSQIAEYLRDVYLLDNDTPSFTGFPIQMIDEMVIFFDLSGKIHVHKLTDIVKLRKYDFKKNDSMQLSNYKKVILNTENENTQGTGKIISGLTIYPTRVFKGKINISKYLIKTRDNLIKIYSYQERTYLYAKPLIFDQDFKLGSNLLFRKAGFKESNNGDLYMQWSTGKAYGFQSKTTVGTTDSEWLPELFDTNILQSDVKTHFFNTLFIGNMNLGSLPAGTRFYTQDKNNLDYSNSLLYSYNPYVEINYNYMLLLGIDYGPYSASLGMFYPIYALNVNNHVREIVSPKTSPTVRFIYYKGDLKIKAIFSISDYNDSNGDIKKNVFVRYAGDNKQVNGYSEYEDDDSTPLKKYSLNSFYFRAGLIYSLTNELKLGLDGIILSGKYSETFQALDLTGSSQIYPQYKNNIKFQHYNAGVYLHNRFSDYVAIKATFNYYYNIYNYNFFDHKDNKILQKCEYGGAFELIF